MISHCRGNDKNLEGCTFLFHPVGYAKLIRVVQIIYAKNQKIKRSTSSYLNTKVYR